MPESQHHKQEKERIRNLARKKGYIAENEIPFVSWSPYRNKWVDYVADIFIFIGTTRPVIIEVDGYKGHWSRFNKKRDERRTEDIQNTWGENIEVHRFTLEELRILTDKEIEQDLGI